MGFFSNVGKWFKKAANTVGSGFKKVVNTLYQDAKSVVSFAGKTINTVAQVPSKVIDKGADTVKSLGGNIQGIAGSLSMPLLLAGGVAVLYMVSKK